MQTLGISYKLVKKKIKGKRAKTYIGERRFLSKAFIIGRAFREKCLQ